MQNRSEGSVAEHVSKKFFELDESDHEEPKTTHLHPEELRCFNSFLDDDPSHGQTKSNVALGRQNKNGSGRQLTHQGCAKFKNCGGKPDPVGHSN